MTNNNKNRWLIGTITVLVIIIIILVATGGYGKGPTLLPNSTTTPVTNSGSTAVAPAPMTGQSLLGIIQGSLTAGGPTVCSFSGVAAQGSLNGNIYVADGDVRADAIFTLSGQVAGTAHVLIDSTQQTMHVWSNNMPQGFAFPWTSTSTMPSSALPSNLYRAFTTAGTYNYSCQVWTPSTFQFTLPSGVAF